MSEHPPVTPKWKRATQAELAAFTREEMCAYVRGSQLAMFDLVAANEGEARKRGTRPIPRSNRSPRLKPKCGR